MQVPNDKVWNSLLCSILVEKNVQRRIRTYYWPPSEMVNNLSTVSALYIYTEPAPNGYGTPAPKVSETVLRAWSFNRKKNPNRRKAIGKYLVNWACWEDDSEYL